MSIGINLFFCSVAEIKSMLVGWSDSLLSRSADQRLISICQRLPVRYGTNLVKSLATELKCKNQEPDTEPIVSFI